MARVFAVLMVGFALAGPAHGQDLDAAALARLITPYVDETTQVVGHVNIEKVNLKRYFDTLTSFAGPKKELADARNLMLSHQENLLKAGVRHVIGVINVREFSGANPPQIIVVAPLGKKAEVDDLIKFAEQLPGVKAKVENHLLVARFGGMDAVEPKRRSEFAEGLEALKNLHIQIVASPSMDVRQFAEIAVPTLPPAVGGGEIALLTKGVRWIGLGYDTNVLTQHYLVQAKDAQTARDLLALVNRGLAALEKAPDFAKLRPLLDVKQQEDRLSLVITEKVLNSMLQSSIDKVRLAAARTKSMNNLKMMGLAMHQHHDTHRALPARASYDANGKPLLSWRVHLLPYLEQQELYKQFKLDEPWDSEHNKKLIARIPDVYASDLSKVKKDGKTTYLAVTGKGTLFDGDKGRRFSEVTDGLSNTMMVVAASDAKAVYWTQPEDFPSDVRDPLELLVVPEIKGFLALLADGSVRFVSEEVRLETLRAVFTRAGGEALTLD